MKRFILTLTLITISLISCKTVDLEQQTEVVEEKEASPSNIEALNIENQFKIDELMKVNDLEPTFIVVEEPRIHEVSSSENKDTKISGTAAVKQNLEDITILPEYKDGRLQKANIAVRWGFICQLISTAIIIVARYLPATDAVMQDSYVSLLGQNWVFVLASLTAYTVSQHWDVWVFHSIRDRYIEKHGSIRGGKWIWNNASTCTSQMLDSVIYVVLAFGFGFGWLFDPSMCSVMVNMIIGQILVKVVIALLDTPIFYLCTRGSDHAEF